MGIVYEGMHELLYLFKWIGYNLGGEKSDEGIAIVWSYIGCIALFGEWFSIWRGEIEVEIIILIWWWFEFRGEEFKIVDSLEFWIVDDNRLVYWNIEIECLGIILGNVWRIMKMIKLVNNRLISIIS